MLLLCLVTLTGSIPFLTSASVPQPISHVIPPIDDKSNVEIINQHQAPAKPPILDRPDGRRNKESSDEDHKLFNFHPENIDHEISWERDLRDAKHNSKQNEVIAAMKHSWDAYRLHAWGADHLRPLTKTKQNWFSVGLTILDSIDTLILMGMKNEYEDALGWIEHSLSFDVYKEVNCFEMTIRVLGGLESAFHLTKHPALLAKAVDVGDRLIHCFDSPSKVVPFSDVNLRTRSPKSPAWSPDSR